MSQPKKCRICMSTTCTNAGRLESIPPSGLTQDQFMNSQLQHCSGPSNDEIPLTQVYPPVAPCTICNDKLCVNRGRSPDPTLCPAAQTLLDLTQCDKSGLSTSPAKRSKTVTEHTGDTTDTQEDEDTEEDVWTGDSVIPEPRARPRRIFPIVVPHLSFQLPLTSTDARGTPSDSSLWMVQNDFATGTPSPSLFSSVIADPILNKSASSSSSSSSVSSSTAGLIQFGSHGTPSHSFIDRIPRTKSVYMSDQSLVALSIVVGHAKRALVLQHRSMNPATRMYFAALQLLIEDWHNAGMTYIYVNQARMQYSSSSMWVVRNSFGLLGQNFPFPQVQHLKVCAALRDDNVIFKQFHIPSSSFNGWSDEWAYGIHVKDTYTARGVPDASSLPTDLPSKAYLSGRSCEDLNFLQFDKQRS